MIFAFVIDTSASMNRQFSDNLSFLECAKAGVEQFFRVFLSLQSANTKSPKRLVVISLLRMTRILLKYFGLISRSRRKKSVLKH
jgi:hypothetical protein